MRSRLGGVHAIIISGDIAFSGAEAEYRMASQWIKRLCEMLDCPEENVWTVPGNHDVDRSVIQRSRQIQLLPEDLRSGTGSVDDRIRRCIFDDEEAAVSIFKPLANYNTFALPFQCDVGPKSGGEVALFWEHELDLKDGTVLHLRGLTSTLVSDDKDDDGKNRLLLGNVQATLPNEDDDVTVAICHHPPEWLLDRDSVEDRFRNRARIQIFGHKHSARHFTISDTLRVSAGAVHPERSESPWLPTYNVLALEVNSKDGRKLGVTIYPRVWTEVDQRFKGEMTQNGADRFTYSLSLPTVTSPRPRSAGPQAIKTPVLENQVSVLAEEHTAEKKVRFMNASRKLIYRFLSLPYLVRLEIARDLSLIREQDSQLTDRELYPLYFVRAKQNHQLERLWDEVEQHHGSQRTENPFKGQ